MRRRIDPAAGPHDERCEVHSVHASGTGFAMPQNTPRFRFVGFVGHVDVSACWTDGFLTADPGLHEWADAIVADGVTFAFDGNLAHVQACLDEVVPSALTLIRCFDRITRCRDRPKW